MDDTAQAKLAEDNLIQAMRCWTESAGGEFRDEGSIVLTTAPVQMHSFNQILVREPVSDAALAEAVAAYRGSDRLRLRFLADVGLTPERMAKVGLSRRGGIPSMVLKGPRQMAVDGLDVRLMKDEATLHDHVGLVANAFDWDSPELESVLTPKLFTDPAAITWVGYLDGEPVTTAQLIVKGETGGIYWVATAEGHRGKGHGGLITRVAVNEAAKRGCRIVGLQASPLGKPVYERLGFQVVAEYETYVAG
jgi:GNAT superfamily N-acetyltransferase